MLDAEHHKRIESLFHQAMELPEDQWRHFLDQACPDDAALRDDVLGLLQATPPTVLNASLDELAALHPPASPAHIGPYHILKEIGRGGMGVVYLAERADGAFKKQVALKLVKHGLDTDEILRRFRYERQILAALEHPNIARLYDGGRSNDGRPFLAMEYIEGEPITAYCDAQQMRIDDRLRLFITVCEAVQYAHSKLVVHRDLKPSNILVSPAGAVKLLDFGIARLLDEKAEDAEAPKTRTGMRIMTPEYASPEQLRGEAPTTAIDVYALGIVLYELLTGRRPRSAATTDRPSNVVARDIERSPKDSASNTITPRMVGASRNTTTDRLRRRLVGDLDTIVMKALRPEAERRYASAAAFLEDIQRHLAGLPVKARPDTLGYRTQKFLERHRVGAGITLVFALMLTAFVVSTIRQEQQMALERDKATEVAAFLETLFVAADPSAPEAGRPDTLRARELLDRGVNRILNDLTQQPDVQARLLTVIGNVYTHLGLYNEADSLLSHALALRTQIKPYNPVDVAESHAALANLRNSESKLAEADSLFRLAIETQRSANTPEALLSSLNGLAYSLQRQGSYEEAESILKEAISLGSTLYEPGDPRQLDALQQLAVLYEDISNYREAERLLREVLDGQITAFGPSHAKVAHTMNDLSLVLRSQESFEAAEQFARQAALINEDAYGPNHPNVATNLENVGAALMGQKQFTEAETAYREALAIFDEVLGPSHQKTIIARTHLAELMRQTGQFEKAIQVYDEVINHFQTTDPDNPGIGIVSALLGNVYLDAMRFPEADSVYRFSIQRMQMIFPDDHIRIGRALNGLGRSLTGQQRFEEAEAVLQKARHIFELRDQHMDLVSESFASLYEAWGKPDPGQQ